ncbi:kelch-like protein 38 [Ciona intestinalis]
MEELLISISGTSLLEERSHKINHGSDLLQFIHTSREDGDFNDVMISVNGKKIPASKMVLSCFSKYFHKMFTTEMKEKYKDCVEVNGVDVESMNNLVQFMYTGEISINMDNVCKLLAVTDYLQMQSVKQLCIQYLMDATSPQNCFTIQVLAERLNIPLLSENNNKFIIKNYPQVICNDHFKGQSKEVATMFLQETCKQVSSDLVYTAVMNWVKFDLASNKSHLNELTKFVDFHEMSPKMLEDLVSVEPLLRTSEDCGATLDALVFQSKCSRAPGKCLISLGGTRTLNKVMKYDLRRNEWSGLLNLPDGRQRASAVVVDGVLYFIAGDLQTGGYNYSFQMNSNKQNSCWERFASSNEKRYAASAAVLKGSIFLFGGKKMRNTILSSGECYIIALEKWMKVANMNEAKHSFALVSLGDQLYSLGGSNTWDDSAVSLVERYDPLSDVWRNNAHMQTARMYFAAVVLNNAIYALGKLKVL